MFLNFVFNISCCEKCMTSLGFLLKPFKNVSHNITFLQLFHYYTLLDLFIEKFLGAYRLCIFFSLISVCVQRSWCLKFCVCLGFCHFLSKILSVSKFCGSFSTELYLSNSFLSPEFFSVDLFNSIMKRFFCKRSQLFFL